MARCGDHAGAAKIAESLVIVPPTDEAIYIQAACGYALAAGAAAVTQLSPRPILTGPSSA